jgi:hypothetical protein
MKSLNPFTSSSGFVLLLPPTPCDNSAGFTAVYNINPVNKDNKVHIILSKKNNAYTGLKISDNKLKENSNLDWPSIKRKLVATATANGANIIAIDLMSY